METGEEDVIPKLFGVLQRYSEGAVAAQERFNGVLRITNTLLGEQAPGGIKRAGIPGKAGTGHLTIPLFAGAPGAGDKLAGAPIAVKEVVDDMKDILQDGVMAVGELAGQLMEGLGTALAGGDMKDIGRGLLESFAGFLQQFGTLLVAYGIARTAFYKSLTSGAAGGGIAIAAGLAMLLAAGAVKGALSKGGGAMSGGGSSGSSGGGGITSQQMKVIVEGRIRGKDIWISNKRYEETNG